MIILYHPRAAQERFRVPLSVLAVASPLVEREEVVVVDADIHRDPMGEIRALIQRATRPPILGVSVMPGPQLASAIPHTRALKQSFPELPVIWGGWFPSLHSETCLKSSYVDYVMRGRVEQAFPVLLDRIRQKGALDDVPNLSWKDRSGRIIHNPEGPLIHPDRLPRVPWSLVRLEAYHQPTWLGSKTTGYHSSYGCPLTCGFCAVASLYQGRWLAQSALRIGEEVEVLRRHGANAIEFFDNNFFVSETRSREVAEVLKDKGLSWWGEGTIDDLLRYKDETLRAMRDSGLKMIFFGAESGSEEVLKRMNKDGLKPGSSLELARRLERFDIVPEFSFVLGNPEAPREDIEASIRHIRRLKEINPRCEIILYLLSPEPYEKSALWQEASKRGFRLPNTLEGWEAQSTRLFQLRREEENPWLSKADRQRVHDFETVLNAYHPGISDIRLGPWARRVLRALSTPRYRLGLYDKPRGLRLALRAFHHRRVEQEGL